MTKGNVHTLRGFHDGVIRVQSLFMYCLGYAVLIQTLVMTETTRPSSRAMQQTRAV